MSRGVLAFAVLAACTTPVSSPAESPSAEPDMKPSSKYVGAIGLWSCISGPPCGSELRASFDLLAPCNYVPFDSTPCGTFEQCTPKHPVSAGVLHTEGTLTPMVAAPFPDGHYPDLTNAGALWRGGEAVRLDADGGALFPFTLSFAAPAPVTIASGLVATRPMTTPNGMTAITPLMIPRNRDLVLTVAAPSEPAQAKVLVYMQSSTTNLVCSFPAASGSYSVPAVALGAFSAGSLGMMIGTAIETTADISEWHLDLLAGAPAVDANGAQLINVAVTLE
jgi:hypothetical protein